MSRIWGSEVPAREGAPGGGPLGTYGDNGVLLYAHRLVLVVLAPQEPHGGGVLPGAGVQKLGPAAHHHESQEVPVFGVSVRDERYLGFSRMFLTRFESGYGYVFRLLVEGYEDRSPRQGEAHGHGVRFAHPVGGGEGATLWRTRKAACLSLRTVGVTFKSLLRRTRMTSEANRRMLVSACSWVTPGRRPQKQRWSGRLCVEFARPRRPPRVADEVSLPRQVLWPYRFRRGSPRSVPHSRSGCAGRRWRDHLAAAINPRAVNHPDTYGKSSSARPCRARALTFRYVTTLPAPQAAGQKPVRDPGGAVYRGVGGGADVDRGSPLQLRSERQVVKTPALALVPDMSLLPSAAYDLHASKSEGRCLRSNQEPRTRAARPCPTPRTKRPPQMRSTTAASSSHPQGMVHRQQEHVRPDGHGLGPGRYRGGGHERRGQVPVVYEMVLEPDPVKPSLSPSSISSRHSA